MGLTPKIAFGVFLGVLAVFLVVHAPGWIEKSREESWYAEAEEAMHGLTPDLAIQRCGGPQKDVAYSFPNNEKRLMYYGDRVVVLTFIRSTGGPWLFLSMHIGRIQIVSGYPVADGTLIEADAGKDNQSFRQVAILPCLERKAK
jgi:hypothetical protein